MHLIFFCFTVIIIVKVMLQSSHLSLGFVKVILGGGGGAQFVLAHFRTLCAIVNHFLSCLFPSIVDDTHIIGPLSIVSFAYEHFQIGLHVIGLSIQLHKCKAWSPSDVPLDFNTVSTPSEIIKNLGVSLGTLTFTSSFIKDALLEDA